MDLKKIDFNKFFHSRIFLIILYALIGILAALIIFRAGMAIGFRKANFSYRMGDNYHRNFAGPRMGFGQGYGEGDFVDAHGSIGQIIKIDPQSLVVKGQDGIEKVINVSDDTSINRFRNLINLSDLKIDDYIVVIGEPNSSGQIDARLIRVMPASPIRQPQSAINSSTTATSTAK